MALDLSALEQRKTVRYNATLPNFRRETYQPNETSSRIAYYFGFPRINRSRFGVLDIFHKESDRLPSSVTHYFSFFNDDKFFAYLYEFYPNGYPNPKKRNLNLIRSREGKGAGTAGFNLIKEDLKKIKVRNLFITPLTERMQEFLERNGFDKIYSAKPLKDAQIEISTYGKVLV